MLHLKSLLLGAAMAAATIVQTHAVLLTVAGDPIGGGELVGNTFTIGDVGGSGNAWPGVQSPPFAINGTALKYLNFAGTDTGYIVTPAIGLSNVTGITFTTADDQPDRDPTTFSLYGSTTAVASTTPGTTFNLLTNFTAITLNQPTGLSADPGRNTTTPEVSIVNPANYTTYVVVFPTLRNNAALMAIGEATLSGTAVPEPTTVSLGLMSGIGMLGFLRRRRRA